VSDIFTSVRLIICISYISHGILACDMAHPSLRPNWITLISGKGYKLEVTFQVLTAASMKMTAFWNIKPCSLVVID
jgi:hypothetical protein